jgi:hypothetical protein
LSQNWPFFAKITEQSTSAHKTLTFAKLYYFGNNLNFLLDLEKSAMSQYVIFTHTTSPNFLPAQKTFFGAPKRYSNDAVLAAAEILILGTLNPDNTKYTTLEEATSSLIGTQANPPIYAVDYTDSIPQIVSATHRGFNYDLSKVWMHQQELLREMNTLDSIYNQYAERPELQEKVTGLKQNILCLKGTLSYQELTTVCKATNQLLAQPNPTPENVAKYKALAERYRNHSPATIALSITMLALAAAFVALTVSLIVMAPGAAIATTVVAGTKSVLFGSLGIFGLYGERQYSQRGLCSAMKDIALAQQQP